MSLRKTLDEVEKFAEREKESVAAELSFTAQLRDDAIAHNLAKTRRKRRQVVRAGKSMLRFLEKLDDELVLMISELEHNFDITCKDIHTKIKAAARKILALIDGSGHSVNNLISELKGNEQDTQTWEDLVETTKQLIHWNGILQGEISRLENIDEGIESRGIEQRKAA